jgi:hypothetical protein
MFSISVLAYLRDRRIRFLLIYAAFLFFALKSSSSFIDSLFNPDESLIIFTGIRTSLTHFFDLVIVILFSIAILAATREKRMLREFDLELKK